MSLEDTVPLFFVLALAVLVVPLILCLALLVRRWRVAVMTAAAWVPLTALLLLPFADQQAYYPWLLLGTRLGVDAVSLPFLLLAVVVWTAAGWHARNRLAPLYRTRFFLFWLLTWTGNLGVFMALDAAGFYSAFALMSLAAYALVVHHGTVADYRAGRVYLVMVLVGEGLLIAGLILVAREAGNVDLQSMQEVWRTDRGSQITTFLLATGFAIKIGIFPLHLWLPLAHPQAPVPASAVLSGVMLKAGLIGWLRFLPIGFEGFDRTGYLIVGIGLFTTFYGALIGLMQQRPKAVLAYSSISQMGLMATGCGLMLLTSADIQLLVGVVGLFALHHGLAKGALFLGVDELQQHPRVARWLILLPAASLAGLPLTSGLLAKSALKDALPESLAWINLLLVLSSLLTALLLLRFLALVWPQVNQERLTWPSSWLFLLLCGLVLPPAYAGWELGKPVLLDFAPGYLWAAIWPVLLAGVLAGLASRGSDRWQWPIIPEGDLIALLPRDTIELPKRTWIELPPMQWPRVGHGLRSAEWKLTRTTLAACMWLVLLVGMLWLMQ